MNQSAQLDTRQQISQSEANEAAECFVVMPFGRKPLPDGRTYDFDKVYRVIISRAVQAAGMKALRADETVGSRLIHADMFKDLRDRPVVLADLSLENPNVFYELGIRHVMSPSGTVLICRKGTELPFDVRLSRVIFYKFDGDDLDWEEVEETVRALTLALQDARHNRPDSPVHVLLEKVLRSAPAASSVSVEKPSDDLDRYQKEFARFWLANDRSIEALKKEGHHRSIFGLRALGYLCLEAPELPGMANWVAQSLYRAEQYLLACSLYAELRSAERLSVDDLLTFASAWSEVHPDVPGVEAALEFVRQALQEASGAQDPAALSNDDEAASKKLARIHSRLGGLLEWKWQLTRSEQDLSNAIDALNIALNYMTENRARGQYRHPGFIAQTRLKLLLLSRIKGAGQQEDAEGHRGAILKINAQPGDDPLSTSYLGWYQAITIADMGDTERANAMALQRLSKDARMISGDESLEIGKRQYVLIRRFLEQYGNVFRNRSGMGMISQHLYTCAHRDERY